MTQFIQHISAVIAILSAAACDTAMPDAVRWAALNADSPPPQLEGAWHSPATGHVVLFSSGGYEIFHELGNFCIRDTGVVPAYALYALEDSARTLRLHYFDYRDHPALLQDPMTFVRMPGLPPSCLETGESGPISFAALFDIVWQTFDRHYVFFDERGVNWTASKRIYRKKATAAVDEGQLFDVFSEMLGELNDGHVNLAWGERFFNAGRPALRARLADAWQKSGSTLSEQNYISKWSRAVRESVKGILDKGSYRSGADSALEWGMINGKTGYLRINRFRNFDTMAPSRPAELETLRKALSAMNTDLQGTERLIVDVAHNGGGNDAAAMTIVEHFMDRPREVLRYAVPGTPAQHIRLAPSGPPETRKILLLTSEITASAAESFVLMMRALPHVTQVGERTRGGISSLLPKPLPLGFRVTVSYQRVMDAEGRLFEGRGIPPHRAMTLFPDGDLYNGYAKAIRQLAE